MTNFIRIAYPFQVKASVDGTYGDFGVSTDGTLEAITTAVSVVGSATSPRALRFKDPADGNFYYIQVYASTSS